MENQDAILKIIGALAVGGIFTYIGRHIYLKNKYEKDNVTLRYDNEIKNVEKDIDNTSVDQLIDELNDEFSD